MAKTFPEQPHTRHAPDGGAPGYTRGSEGVGAGHEDYSRMPQPNEGWHQGPVKSSDNFGKSGTKTNHES